jgi:hypothetical protein
MTNDEWPRARSSECRDKKNNEWLRVGGSEHFSGYNALYFNIFYFNKREFILN